MIPTPAFTAILRSRSFDQVAKSSVAQRQLLQCGDDLHLKEEVENELFRFVQNVIYSDTKSNNMAEAMLQSGKTKSRSFIRIPPDSDSMHQHCLRQTT